MKNCTIALKSKEVEGIFGEDFILALLSLTFFRLQNRVSDFLICFARKVKSFYQSSLGNEVDFRDIMSVFPNMLDKN